MKLICPVCGKALTKADKSAVCENGHSFDYARQGYLNLLIRQSVDHGDNKEMVRARTKFLESGAYGFLKEELKSTVSALNPFVLADLGCGEGYYTSVLPAEEKYGFDMSREALKHAAARDKSTQYAVASIFHLPLMDTCCDCALTCFAPFASEEVFRILKPGGTFIFVSPGPKHLIELKELIYQHPYENEIKVLSTSLELKEQRIISSSFEADHDNLVNLFKMTPYYHRTKEEDKARIENVSHLKVTAEFVIRLFTKAS